MENSKRLFRAVFFLALFLCFTISIASAPRFCSIRFIGERLIPVKMTVEVADTDILRSRGLMFRRSLDPDGGILFVFDDDAPRSFWMKNTYLPLSIAYIGVDGTIHEIYDMEPLDISKTYPSVMPARYALEVHKGWFKRHGIVPGCRVVFDGCLGK